MGTRLIGFCLLSWAMLAVGQETSPKIRVAVYKGEGTSGSLQTVLQALKPIPSLEVLIVSAEDIQTGKLKDYDVIIHSGGSGGGQGKALGEMGRKQIREFVSNGGGYIGICAGAYLATTSYDWSLHILDAEVLDRKHWARGFGNVQLTFTENGKSFFEQEQLEAEIYYHQGPLLAPGKDPKIPDYQPLAKFKTEIAKNGAPSGVMPGTTAIAHGEFGKGKVIVFSPHPEKMPATQPFLKKALEFTGKKN